MQGLNIKFPYFFLTFLCVVLFVFVVLLFTDIKYLTESNLKCKQGLKGQKYHDI